MDPDFTLTVVDGRLAWRHASGRTLPYVAGGDGPTTLDGPGPGAQAARYLRTQAKAKLGEAQAIAAKATAATRPLTGAERADVERLLAEVDALNGERKGIDDSVALTKRIDDLNAAMTGGGRVVRAKGLADALLEAGLGHGPDSDPFGPRLSFKGGITSVAVLAHPIFGASAADVGAKAMTSPALADLPARVEGGVVQLGADQRFAYPRFPSQDLGTDLNVNDFRQSVRGAITGAVERSPVATTDKAVIAETVVATSEPVVQEAIILDGIPLAVVESIAGFRAWVDSELRFQIGKAIDAHTYTKVNANASHANTGTGLIAQLRNGVAVLQAAGYAPNLAIVNPNDAVSLDLSTTGADAAYVFALRDIGSSDPLWGLRFVVRAGAGTEPPLLVDTARVGVLYMATLSIDADPYAGVGGANFKKNLVDIRAEVNVLMHVRAPLAAHRIAAT
jgi:hypothetical protein